MPHIKKLVLLLFIYCTSSCAFADCPELDAGQLQSLSKAELLAKLCQYREEVMPLKGKAHGAGEHTQEGERYNALAHACGRGFRLMVKTYQEAKFSPVTPNCMEDKDYAKIQNDFAEKENRAYVEKKIYAFGLDRVERYVEYMRISVEPNLVVQIVANDRSAERGVLSEKSARNNWAPTSANMDKVLRVICRNKMAQDLMQHGASFVFKFVNESGLLGSIPVQAKDCE